MSGADALWRVYFPEFVPVYTSNSTGSIGQEECRSIFVDKYAGRVPEEDYQIHPLKPVHPSIWQLMLQLPNLKGEFKDKADADKLRVELGQSTPPLTAWVVQFGSAEERVLLDYGKRRIRLGGS
jgi:hypothetical protein